MSDHRALGCVGTGGGSIPWVLAPITWGSSPASHNDLDLKNMSRGYSVFVSRGTNFQELRQREVRRTRACEVPRTQDCRPPRAFVGPLSRYRILAGMLHACNLRASCKV